MRVRIAPNRPWFNDSCWWDVQVRRRFLFLIWWSTIGEYATFSAAKDTADIIKDIDTEGEGND